MTRPWQTLDAFDTADGAFALRQRGASEFLITLDGRVLMNSAANRSEVALGRAACEALPSGRAPRVLIGGLGMGCTLRAALDALPDDARVRVSEIQPGVVRWCRGPLAGLTHGAVRDRRVEIRIEDVADALAEAGRAGSPRFDAVLLDLYEGAHAGSQRRRHPHFGAPALARARAALGRRGILAIWTEQSEPNFEAALGKAGFEVTTVRPAGSPRRHVVYLARRDDSGTPKQARGSAE